LSLPSLAALYRGCSLLFHPVQPSVWGDPLRLALAAGRPIVGVEAPAVSGIVGPAAYLVPAADARKQGAAMLTVLVEESLADHLASSALQRAGDWSDFAQAYRQLLTP
jgi:glycosyltransferase involved in cell wall biosynthesis